MSLEPSTESDPKDATLSAAAKGKGRAVAAAEDGPDESHNGIVNGHEGTQATSNGALQNKRDNSDGLPVPPVPTETPEAMRSQLEAVRRDLVSNLQRKQGIDRALATHEMSIYAFETSYLSVDLSGGTNAAPFGNIVRGYDSYLKTGAAASHGSESSTRKKGGTSTRGYTTGIVGPGGSLMQTVADEDRIFSRSSKTFQESLQLRERDSAVASASEPEDEGDDDSASAAGGRGSNREAKRQRRK